MSFQVMTDGHPTTLAFSLGANIKFYEKTITPPAVDGGGKNDTTTQHNTAWRTAMPKHLKELKEMSLTVAYDPAVYPQIVAMINVNQQLTITFPDGSTLVFWGWLDSFEPKELKEGEQPTADVKVQCGNMNGSLAETAPSYTTGTTSTTSTTLA